MTKVNLNMTVCLPSIFLTITIFFTTNSIRSGSVQTHSVWHLVIIPSPFQTSRPQFWIHPFKHSLKSVHNGSICTPEAIVLLQINILKWYRPFANFLCFISLQSENLCSLPYYCLIFNTSCTMHNVWHSKVARSWYKMFISLVSVYF